MPKRKSPPLIKKGPTKFLKLKKEKHDSTSSSNNELIPTHQQSQLFTSEIAVPGPSASRDGNIRDDNILRNADRTAGGDRRKYPNLIDPHPVLVDPDVNAYTIVIDTNMMVKSLELINELKDLNIYDTGKATLYFPWIVLNEIDKLKTDKKITDEIRAAVKFLSAHLNSKNNLRGQWLTEAQAIKNNVSDVKDDRILESCLALQRGKAIEKVILLTDDVHLGTKARVMNITCATGSMMRAAIAKMKSFTRLGI